MVLPRVRSVPATLHTFVLWSVSTAGGAGPHRGSAATRSMLRRPLHAQIVLPVRRLTVAQLSARKLSAPLAPTKLRRSASRAQRGATSLPALNQAVCTAPLDTSTLRWDRQFVDSVKMASIWEALTTKPQAALHATWGSCQSGVLVRVAAPIQ
jgi:hypothetical protein